MAGPVAQAPLATRPAAATSSSIPSGGAGEEGPGDRVRAETRAVLGQLRRRVACRIDGDGDQVKVGPELARPAANFGHFLTEQRAGLLAGGEDEIGDPNPAGELARAERLPALIGQREGGEGAEDRRRGTEAPGDRTKDWHSEKEAQQRRPDEGIARQSRRHRSGSGAKFAGKTRRGTQGRTLGGIR